MPPAPPDFPPRPPRLTDPVSSHLLECVRLNFDHFGEISPSGARLACRLWTSAPRLA